MSLHLTGKGSILDAIGGAANTVANAGIAGAKDIGDLVGAGVADVTGNQKAELNATTAISNNDSNLTNGNVATNLGGLSQDTGATQAAKSFINTGAGLATDIVNKAGDTNETSEQAVGGGPLGDLTNWASDNGTVNEGTKRNVIGNTVQTAVNFATLGKGKALEEGAEMGINKMLGNTALDDAGNEIVGGNLVSKVSARLGGGATAAGAYGAGSGSANAIETAKTGKQAVEDIVKPTLENAAFGVVGGGITKAPDIVDAIKSNMTPLNDIGAVGKDVNGLDQTPAVPPDYSLNEGETRTPNPTTYPITPTPTDVPAPADLAKSNQAAQVLDANIENPTVDWSKVSGATKELNLKKQALAEQLRDSDKMKAESVNTSSLYKAIKDEGGITRDNVNFTTRDYPSHILAPADRGLSLDEMANKVGFESSSDLDAAIRDTQFNKTEGAVKVKPMAQYKEQAEAIIRSDPKTYDNVGARADAEKSVKDLEAADRASGYSKAKFQLPKGAKAIPWIRDLQTVLRSPEYADKKLLGRLLGDPNNPDPDSTRGMIQSVKQLMDQAKKASKALNKRGSTADEATKRAVAEEFRRQKNSYEALKRIEREQAGEYARKAIDLDNKYDYTLNAKKGVRISSRNGYEVATPGSRDLAETKVPVRIISKGGVAKTTTLPDASISESSPTYSGPNLNEGAFGEEDQAKLDQAVKDQQADHEKYLQNFGGNAAILDGIRRGASEADKVKSYMEVTGGSLEDAKKANGIVENNTSYDKAGDPKNNPSYGTIKEFKTNDEAARTGIRKVLVRSARSARNKILLGATRFDPRFTVQSSISSKLYDALSPEAKAAADHLSDSNTSIDSIEKTLDNAKDKTAFRNYAERLKQSSNDNFEINRITNPGDTTGFTQNYGTGRYYTKPGQDAVIAESDLFNDGGTHALSRKYNSYEEALADNPGLERATKNVQEDHLRDIARTKFYAENRELFSGLAKQYGDRVAYDKPTGTANVQLKDYKSIFADKDLANQINKRARYDSSEHGKLLNTLDSINGGMKTMKLALGGFHIINEGLNVASILPSGIPEVAKSFASQNHFDNLIQGYEKSGQLDKMGAAGLTVGSSLEDDRTLADKLSSKNIKGAYQQIMNKVPGHNALFERQIPATKMLAFDHFAHDLDMNNPADYEKMRGLARGLNNTIGGANRLVDSMSPRVMKMFARAILATDYNEGQIRTLLTALDPTRVGTLEGRLARQVVAGRATILAIPGVAQAIVTHKIGNNPEQIAKFVGNQLLNPTVQTGFKTAGGIPKQINLVSGIVNKADRAIAPFFNKQNPNKFSGVESELGGNTSPLLSAAEEEYKNKDYYGNPMHGNGLNAAEDVGQLVNSAAPIPFSPGGRALEGYKGLATNPVVRTLAGGQSKISPTEAAIDISGIGRVEANPTAPEMVILNSRQMLASTLKTTAEKNALQDIEPSWDGSLTKAGVTAKYADKNYEINKWTSLNENGVGSNVYNVLKQQNAVAVKNGEPSNPLLSLNSTNYNILTKYEQLKQVDEGPDANNTAAVMYAQNKAMINKYETDNATYGDQMNALYAKTSGTKGSNSPVETVGGVPNYTATPQQTALSNQYYAMTDANSTSAQRVQFLTDNPELVQLMNIQLEAENKIRAQQDEPQLKAFPQPAPALNTWMNNYTAASKTERTALRTANPSEYNQMSQYMATVDQYDLAKTLGQTQEVGSNVTQSQLKEEYDLGQYDIDPEVAGDVTTYSLNPQAAYTASQSTGSDAEVTKLLNDIERTGAKEAIKYAGKKAYIAKPHKNKIFIRSAKALPQKRAPVKIKAKVTQLA